MSQNLMATEPPSRKLIEEQTARILASPGFAKSERMARFLRFIVERTIADQAGELKEYTIALAVFDKDESFDPRIDSIVRGEARRLRSKLAEYYEGAGAEDPLVIELPKGAYAPLFHDRGLELRQPPVRRWGAVAVAAVAVVLVGAAGWWIVRHPSSKTVRRSIAVLPLENLTGDPANDYFSDGLTEEILNALANVPGLHVAARTSVFQFKGRHEDIRTIAARLNVEMVLEGSVRKDGARVRITPQLINAADGYALWSKEFDREWKDVFAVQQEIAGAIARTLGGRLDRAASEPAPETYRLYLEARHYFNHWNTGGMQKAIPLFEQVVARDPKYAPGYAGLASAYGLFSALGGTSISREESGARAKQAALRAIELDPNLPAAWASLAPKLVEELDWPAAESAFRKAIEVGPNLPDAHSWYAELCLTPMGRLEEALRESETAAALDPLSPYAVAGMGRRHYFMRHYDQAIGWFRKALELDPQFHQALAGTLHAYLAKGDTAGGRRFLEEEKAFWPDRRLAPFWAQQLAAEGRTTEARALIPGLNLNECQAAAIYSSLGDQAQAISWLDRVIDTRAGCFTWIPTDPLYDRWRATAEFHSLIARLKLPASH